MIEDDTYFQESADSLALITLFDALPDYCLTPKFWQRVGALCPAALLDKLQSIDKKDTPTNG